MKSLYLLMNEKNQECEIFQIPNKSDQSENSNLISVFLKYRRKSTQNRWTSNHVCTLVERSHSSVTLLSGNQRQSFGGCSIQPSIWWRRVPAVAIARCISVKETSSYKFRTWHLPIRGTTAARLRTLPAGTGSNSKWASIKCLPFWRFAHFCNLLELY